MARFFLPLSLRLGISLLGVVGILAFSTSLPADLPAPSTQVKPKPVPANTSATNTVPISTSADSMSRFSKMFKPSSEASVSHPAKLNMSFSGFGEMKIPTQDELNMREKLEQLSTLSDADIRAQLAQWPAYSKMNLKEEGGLLQRIQDFRDHRSKVARTAAHDIGLLTLTPDQQTHFEKDYWAKRLQMEHDLSKQFEPIAKAREDKMNSELFREFSSSNTMGPPAPKSVQKTPPVTQAKPSSQTAVAQSPAH